MSEIFYFKALKFFLLKGHYLFCPPQEYSSSDLYF